MMSSWIRLLGARQGKQGNRVKTISCSAFRVPREWRGCTTVADLAQVLQEVRHPAKAQRGGDIREAARRIVLHADRRAGEHTLAVQPERVEEGLVLHHLLARVPPVLHEGGAPGVVALALPGRDS